MYLVTYKEDTDNGVYTDLYFTHTLEEAIEKMEAHKDEIAIYNDPDPLLDRAVMPSDLHKKARKAYIKKYYTAWYYDTGNHAESKAGFSYHNGDNEYHFCDVFLDVGPDAHQLNSLSI